MQKTVETFTIERPSARLESSNLYLNIKYIYENWLKLKEIDTWVHNQTSLTKFRTVLEEEVSRQYLRKKKTLEHWLDENLVPVEVGKCEVSNIN